MLQPCTVTTGPDTRLNEAALRRLRDRGLLHILGAFDFEACYLFSQNTYRHAQPTFHGVDCLNKARSSPLRPRTRRHPPSSIPTSWKTQLTTKQTNERQEPDHTPSSRPYYLGLHQTAHHILVFNASTCALHVYPHKAE